MKAKFRLIPVLLSMVMVFGIFSCEKKADETPAPGKLTISVAMSEALSTLKSGAQDTIIFPDSTIFSSYQLLISVTGANGEMIFEDKLIPVYGFGNGFVSEQIEIRAGEFFLTKFMVLNNLGRVIYATPVDGSPRAYLVNQPVPLFFSIYPGETTQMAPEVLPVEGFTPSDFGYATFMVQVVKPWPFYVMAMLDNPLLMRPSLLTDAELYVMAPDGWSHNFKLQPMVNKLEIRAAQYYEMVVFKEGFPEVRLKLTGREILASSENNPYIIYIGSQEPFQTLKLKPGPEIGMDAMISNLEPDKNFGNHKYFEAAFLSEPVLTVMRSNRSLIWFNLGQLPKSAVIKSVYLNLYYDLPIPWDETEFRSKGLWDSQYPWYGAVLQQVIEPWKEESVTWNTQPKTTEIGQVLVDPFNLNTNMVSFDVTSIYVPNPNTDNIPLPNYGMMLRLYPEEKFPGFRFASSDYPEDYMRPELIVNYVLYDYATGK